MSDKKHYSCVFARWQKSVLLVRKSHPDWQSGRMNGVGGAVEEGETPLACAQREFEEETGIGAPDDIREFCVLEDSQVIVHFYSGSLPDTGDIKSMIPATNDIGEALEFCSLSNIQDYADSSEFIDNLCWLIPMAFYDKFHMSASVTAYRRQRENEESPWVPVV